MLGPEDLLELDADFRASLQPYVRLLALQYPVDDLRIQVSRASEDRGAASNTALKQKHRTMTERVARSNPDPTFLAVHRLDYIVYYRRLNAYFISGLELAGGFFLILGLGSRLIALPLAIDMMVAYIAADREALFSIFSDPDKFTGAAPYTFLVASLIVLILGPGKASVDAFLTTRLSRDDVRRAIGHGSQAVPQN